MPYQRVENSFELFCLRKASVVFFVFEAASAALQGTISSYQARKLHKFTTSDLSTVRAAASSLALASNDSIKHTASELYLLIIKPCE